MRYRYIFSPVSKSAPRRRRREFVSYRRRRCESRSAPTHPPKKVSEFPIADVVRLLDRFRKFLVRTRRKRPSSLSAPNLEPKGSYAGTPPAPQPPHDESPRESPTVSDDISTGFLPASLDGIIPARLSSIADFLLLSSTPRRCEVMTD